MPAVRGEPRVERDPFNPVWGLQSKVPKPNKTMQFPSKQYKKHLAEKM